MACLQPAVPFHRQAAVPEKVLKGEAGDEEGWARASIQRTPSLGRTEAQTAGSRSLCLSGT